MHSTWVAWASFLKWFSGPGTRGESGGRLDRQPAMPLRSGAWPFEEAGADIEWISRRSRRLPRSAAERMGWDSNRSSRSRSNSLRCQAAISLLHLNQLTFRVDQSRLERQVCSLRLVEPALQVDHAALSVAKLECAIGKLRHPLNFRGGSASRSS